MYREPHSHLWVHHLRGVTPSTQLSSPTDSTLGLLGGPGGLGGPARGAALDMVELLGPSLRKPSTLAGFTRRCRLSTSSSSASLGI